MGRAEGRRHASAAVPGGDERTKTGETDDTMILGTTSCTWTVQFFARWVALRDAERDGGRLFPRLDLAGLDKIFREARSQLSLHKIVVTPHVAQHPGPSHDILHNLRIQRRGRWACAESCRRYEKSGRLLLQFAKIPAAVLHRAEQAQDSRRAQLISAIQTRLVSVLRTSTSNSGIKGALTSCRDTGGFPQDARPRERICVRAHCM